MSRSRLRPLAPLLKTGLLAVLLLAASLFVTSLPAQDAGSAPAAGAAAAGGAPAGGGGDNATPPPAKATTVWDMVYQGGFVMVLLGIASICLVWFAAEGFVILRSNKLAPPALVARLREAFKAGNYQEAWNICKANKCFLSNVLGNGLERIGRNKDAVEFIVEETAIREANDLKTNTTYLSVIGVVSPMIGLTGTVWGMIGAFKALGDNGISNPSLLAGKIGEVLIATMSGLVVAVPAFIFFYVLRARAQERHSLRRVAGLPAARRRALRAALRRAHRGELRLRRGGEVALAAQQCFPEGLAHRDHELPPPATRRSRSAPPRARTAARCSTGRLGRHKPYPPPCRQPSNAPRKRKRIDTDGDPEFQVAPMVDVLLVADAFLHGHHLDRGAEEEQEPGAGRCQARQAGRGQDPQERDHRPTWSGTASTAWPSSPSTASTTRRPTR
ncbi:MAG: MotA/TolQ/ExbB proton channel family protein [Verrucomicrobiota bacterium]